MSASMIHISTRRDGLTGITIAQGGMRVSSSPNEVLTTILGSCVATCLFDPVAKIGGLNHYLLAEGGGEDPQSMQRYGLYAMEVLINEMLARGGARNRLRARVYGGATMNRGFRDIGGANVAFARRFLRDERIALVGEDVGGHGARRVEFRPTLGLARCRIADTRPAELPRLRVVPPPPPASLGDVEFF
jgi:chemotaxis protein CheD